ncbi:MAG: DUF6029 family protein [Crocinitomicaceae bacterium]
MYTSPTLLKFYSNKLFLASIFLLIIKNASAQLNFGKPTVTGNVETIFQYLQSDSTIDAFAPEQKAVMNSYANINYSLGNFKAGVRLESYMPSVAGYPAFYSGSGIGYRFLEYSNDKVTAVAGNFFEQFGSGLILRSYEERAIGLDNAMEGAKINFKPISGVNIKGVFGKMRSNFNQGRVELSEGIIRGLDGDFSLNQIFKGFKESKLKMTFGGSFVSRYQGGSNDTIILPKNVAAYGGRFDIKYNNFYLNGEYIHKINDPSANNNYIYNKGHGAIVNMGYSQKGLAVLFSAKSIDNMFFRADRTVTGNQLMIGFLPALTKNHTYNLAASLYPYASAPSGEVAYQLDVLYKIPRKSFLGGKYGVDINMNIATVFKPIRHSTGSDFRGNRLLYEGRPYDKSDSLYHFDFNVEIKKKISKKFKLTASYFHFIFNNDVNEVTKDASGYVQSDIVVLDGAYKINRKHSIRAEVQALFTEQDKGNWATFLMEYTVSPHWFAAVIYQSNYGNPDKKKRQNYPFASFGYTLDASRFIVSYGKQRAGIFCIGGVCREVPATNGLTFSFTTTF